MIVLCSFLLFLVPCLGAPASHDHDDQPVSSRGNVISIPLQFNRSPKTISTRTRRETPYTPTVEDIKEMYRKRSSHFASFLPKGISDAEKERIIDFSAFTVAIMFKQPEAEREKFRNYINSMNTVDPTRFLTRTKRETLCGVYDSEGLGMNTPEDCERHLEKISRGRSNNAFLVRTKRGQHAGEEPGSPSNNQSKRSSLNGPIKIDPQTTGPNVDIPQREKRQVSGQAMTKQSNTFPDVMSDVDPYDEFEEELEEGRGSSHNTHQDLPENPRKEKFEPVAAKIFMINQFANSEVEANVFNRLAEIDIHKFIKNNIVIKEDSDEQETDTRNYREKITPGKSNDFLVRTKRGHHAGEEPGSPLNNQSKRSSLNGPIKIDSQTTGPNVDIPQREKSQVSGQVTTEQSGTIPDETSDADLFDEKYEENHYYYPTPGFTILTPFYEEDEEFQYSHPTPGSTILTPYFKSPCPPGYQRRKGVCRKIFYQSSNSS